MISRSHLAGACLFMVLAVGPTVSPHEAEAQRRDAQSYTLVLGSLDFLYAAGVVVDGSSLTPRTDVSRTRRLVFTGLSVPPGGAKGGDCGFVAPTCNGTVRVTDPNAPAGRICFKLYDVQITGDVAQASEGVLTEELSINFTRMAPDPECEPW